MSLLITPYMAITSGPCEVSIIGTRCHCHRHFFSYLSFKIYDDVNYKCVYILSFSQVGSDFLDRILNSKGNKAYTSVLFYASWCPFSHNVRSTFKTLSAMFPHIEHLEVEESSVVPRWYVHLTSLNEKPLLSCFI